MSNSPKTKYSSAMAVGSATLDWFDLHFPASSSFHGRFCLGTRKADESEIRMLCVKERGDMRQFLEELPISAKKDYYISANSVCGVRRLRKELFSLDNIVVDLDCHGQPLPDDYADSLLWRLKRDRVVPMPNSIVHTGRGIQLWWHITPIHVSWRRDYVEVRSFILRRLEGLREEYDELSAAGIDYTSSRNLVGFFRLPGTFNTKSETVVTVEQICNTEYTLQDMTAWVRYEKEQEPEEQPPPSPPPEPARDFSGEYSETDILVFKGFYTFGLTRMRQLVQLRIMRDSKIGNETRDKFCFIAYNAMLPSLGHETAFEKLRYFNAGFRQPMTEHELENVICAARDIGGYKYTNRSMIRFLGITRDEQAAIGLVEPTRPYEPLTRMSGHPSRRASAKLVRDDRNAKILALAKSGKNKSEIANELGLAWNTVSSVLKESGYNRHQEILDALDSGLSEEAVAERCGCCVRTVRNAKRKKSLK